MLLKYPPLGADFQPDVEQGVFSCAGFWYSGIHHKKGIWGDWCNDRNYHSFYVFLVFVVFQFGHYEGFVRNRSFGSYPPWIYYNNAKKGVTQI